MQTSPQSLSLNAKEHFPFFNWVAKTLSGRWALRTYLAILFLLLLISTAARLRSYFMVRKIEDVLQGLSKIRLDQTTEEQMTKMVPYLTAKDWTAGGFSYRSYYVHISNESGGVPWPYALTQSNEFALRLGQLGDWLGYRYIRFDAGVLVQEGKVSQADYGLANQ